MGANRVWWYSMIHDTIRTWMKVGTPRPPAQARLDEHVKETYMTKKDISLCSIYTMEYLFHKIKPRQEYLMEDAYNPLQVLFWLRLTL